MATFRMGQAAQLLGVSADTLRRWADAGRLPTTRTEGGRRVVQGTDLAELARSLAVEPDAGAIVSAS
ncbi:MAG: helix-turn-helix domain-containing protein, partial [Acidimicrobiales bacterium]|nr:helix-turn-helix domain-containing protein [Acidimicrobiales bacterium]